jgi:hypothetical protein
MINKGICEAIRNIVRSSNQKQWTTPALAEEVEKAGHSFTRKQITNAVHRTLIQQGVFVDSGEMLGRAVIFDVVEDPPKLRTYKETIEKSPATIAAEAGVEKQALKRIEDLKATITELEDKENVSLITLGRAIERALVDKAVKINRLESQMRDQAAKQAKIRSDDRSMIGSLQKRILDLEAEVRQLRESIKRTEGVTFGGKPINIKALTS